MGKSVVYLFTDDLRVQDNPGLAHAARMAAESSLPLVGLALLDSSPPNLRATAFRQGAILDLASRIPLVLLRGPARTGSQIHALLARRTGRSPDDLYVLKRGHTPESQLLVRALTRLGSPPIQIIDALYDFSPIHAQRGSDEPYYVFAAFAKAAAKLKPLSPKPFSASMLRGLMTRSRAATTKKSLTEEVELILEPTREAGLKMLRAFDFAKYGQDRNILSKPTSQIAAYLHAGLVSVREAWQLAGKRGDAWRRQLLWLEFFSAICERRGYEQLKPYRGPSWPVTAKAPHRPELGLLDQKARFRLWATAKTGHPLVDAGMRELLTTGLMHNRARLVCANYLVQHLRCDWHLGERFFARQLLDYEPAVNNGNWQIIAGTGTDRYNFRPYNPDLQMRKYDPGRAYIAKWSM